MRECHDNCSVLHFNVHLPFFRIWEVSKNDLAGLHLKFGWNLWALPWHQLHISRRTSILVHHQAFQETFGEIRLISNVYTPFVFIVEMLARQSKKKLRGDGGVRPNWNMFLFLFSFLYFSPSLWPNSVFHSIISCIFLVLSFNMQFCIFGYVTVTDVKAVYPDPLQISPDWHQLQLHQNQKLKTRNKPYIFNVPWHQQCSI